MFLVPDIVTMTVPDIMRAPDNVTVLLFGLYIIVELIRLILLLRYQRKLHDNRTPLSEGFDRREWGEFFVAALKRECSLGSDFLREFVSSMFDLVPVSELSRGDVDKFLQFYVSCREHDVDGPLEPWARELAEEARRLIESSLGFTFVPGRPCHLFTRINHPRLDHHAPAAYLRPLPIAAIIRSARIAVRFYLRFGLGFERWVDEPTGYVFWHHRRHGQQPARERRGLLFVTGLGQGVTLYPHHAKAFVRSAAMARRYSDVCVCEAPGISGTPLRASLSYPTAREAVEAVERFKRRALGESSPRAPTLDCIAHSAGAFLPSYASRYSPSLFERVVYAEAPAVHFTHCAKSWPILFSRERYTVRTLLRHVWERDFGAITSWLVMSEAHHQFGARKHTKRSNSWPALLLLRLLTSRP